MREVAYFTERSGHVCLPTRDENACCNDRIEGFAAQELLLVGALVELLGNVADGFWKRELVTPI